MEYAWYLLCDLSLVHQNILAGHSQPGQPLDKATGVCEAYGNVSGACAFRIQLHAVYLSVQLASVIRVCLNLKKNPQLTKLLTTQANTTEGLFHVANLSMYSKNVVHKCGLSLNFMSLAIKACCDEEISLFFLSFFE